MGPGSSLTQPMDPEKKSLNFIFPTKYVIPKSLSRLAIGQVSNSVISGVHITLINGLINTWVPGVITFITLLIEGITPLKITGYEAHLLVGK